MQNKYLKCLAVFLVVSTAHLNAQTYTYEPLLASGTIPNDFTQEYLEKVRNEQNKVSKDLSKRERKKQLDFHEYNEFALDLYLTSGSILYGDEVTLYLNDVLDKILEKNTKLRNELRIYAVRSASFNAFTTNDGIILVNLGLISELETEAQLAYIICHEIAHYTEQHVLRGYDFKNSISNSREYKLSADKLARQFSDYDKDQELEADELGYLTYFSETNYNRQAPFEIMDIMLYSYLPFDEVPFSVDFLATANYGIAANSLRDFEATSISARDDVSDKLSTHPNIKRRREALSDFAALKNEGENFLVSKERFLDVRTHCRYENLEQYLSSALYDRALYQCYLLMQTDPNNPFLERARAYAIYATSIYRNHYKYPGAISNMKNVEGQLSHVRHILKEISQEDLNVLAVSTTYEFYRNHPEDPLAKKMFDHAVWELTHFHEKTLKMYQKAPLDADGAPIAEQPKDSITLNTGSKVKRLQGASAGEAFERIYAFSAYLEDSIFKETFSYYEKDYDEYQDKLPRKQKYKSDREEIVYLKELRDPDFKRSSYILTYPEKKINTGGQGVKSTLFVTPLSFTLAGAKGIQFKKSVKREEAFIANIVDNAELLGINYTLLDYKYLDKKDASAFNDLQALQLWMDERLEHDNIYIVNYSLVHVSPILEKYDASNLTFIGMLSLNKSGMTSIGYVKFYEALIAVGLFPVFSPIIITTAFIPTYESFQFILSYDLKTGKEVMSKSNSGRHYRQQAVVNNMIYEQLLELQAAPKFIEE